VVLLWFCCGFVVVLLWFCCGFVVVLLWFCCGFVVVLLWFCCGFVVVLLLFCSVVLYHLCLSTFRCDSGMMLAFGDLTWVPFTYSLQSRYLVHHDPLLSHVTLCFIVGVKILGYTAFRGSNGEKDRFRTNPNDPTVQHLETITTKTGRKLLISGWWGMARKINYSADWLMGLSWCAVCGIGSIIPYFYSIYFAILLIHRAWRDDHACHDKYGASWLLYKKKVPYVFIPGIV
jgi:delta14-sterol reductase